MVTITSRDSLEISAGPINVGEIELVSNLTVEGGVMQVTGEVLFESADPTAQEAQLRVVLDPNSRLVRELERLAQPGATDLTNDYVSVTSPVPIPEQEVDFSNLRQRREERLTVTPGDTEEFSFPEIPYTQIELPDVDVINDALNEMPNLSFAVELRPDSGVTDYWWDLTNNIPRTFHSLDPSVFVSFTSLDPTDCVSIYPDAHSMIEDLEDGIEGLPNDLRDIRETLDSHLEVTEEEIDGNIRFVSPQDVLDSIREDPDFGLDQDMMNRWSSDLETADDLVDQYNVLISDLSDTRTYVEGNVSGDCLTEFTSRLDDIASVLNETGDIASDVETLLSRLDFALDVADFPEVEVDDLGCDDVPQLVMNAVAELETSADMMVQRPVEQLREDRLRELLDEADEVQSLVNDRVSDENPCKQQLTRRRRNAEQEVRDLLDELDEASDVDLADLPCSQQFPDVDEALTDLRNRVRRVTTDITETELDEIITTQRDVEQKIRQVDNPECASEFASRLESIGRQLDRTVSPIRITEGQIGEAQRQRQEMIEFLRERIGEAVPDPEVPGVPDVDFDDDVLEGEFDVDLDEVDIDS